MNWGHHLRFSPLGLQLSNVSSELVCDKLESVYQIMGAKGRVRQKRSRPLRAKLTVRCPKFAIRLETGTESSPMCFEAAMHKLDLQLLAGSQQHQQLQSGAGPISIEVKLLQLITPSFRLDCGVFRVTDWLPKRFPVRELNPGPVSESHVY